MNITLVYFFFNNSICSLNDILKINTNYIECNSENKSLCCINYKNMGCYNNTNSSYFVDCFRTENEHVINSKPNRIIIIVSLSFCVLLCILPFVIKCIECIQNRIINKKYKKYEPVYTTIMNPCYDPESVNQ